MLKYPKLKASAQGKPGLLKRPPSAGSLLSHTASRGEIAANVVMPRSEVDISDVGDLEAKKLHAQRLSEINARIEDAISKYEREPVDENAAINGGPTLHALSTAELMAEKERSEDKIAGIIKAYRSICHDRDIALDSLQDWFEFVTENWGQKLKFELELEPEPEEDAARNQKRLDGLLEGVKGAGAKIREKYEVIVHMVQTSQAKHGMQEELARNLQNQLRLGGEQVDRLSADLEDTVRRLREAEFRARTLSKTLEKRTAVENAARRSERDLIDKLQVQLSSEKEDGLRREADMQVAVDHAKEELRYAREVRERVEAGAAEREKQLRAAQKEKEALQDELEAIQREHQAAAVLHHNLVEEMEEKNNMEREQLMMGMEDLSALMRNKASGEDHETVKRMEAQRRECDAALVRMQAEMESLQKAYDQQIDFVNNDTQQSQQRLDAEVREVEQLRRRYRDAAANVEAIRQQHEETLARLMPPSTVKRGHGVMISKATNTAAQLSPFVMPSVQQLNIAFMPDSQKQGLVDQLVTRVTELEDLIQSLQVHADAAAAVAKEAGSASIHLPLMPSLRPTTTNSNNNDGTTAASEEASGPESAAGEYGLFLTVKVGMENANQEQDEEGISLEEKFRRLLLDREKVIAQQQLTLTKYRERIASLTDGGDEMIEQGDRFLQNARLKRKEDENLRQEKQRHEQTQQALKASRAELDRAFVQIAELEAGRLSIANAAMGLVPAGDPRADMIRNALVLHEQVKLYDKRVAEITHADLASHSSTHSGGGGGGEGGHSHPPSSPMGLSGIRVKTPDVDMMVTSHSLSPERIRDLIRSDIALLSSSSYNLLRKSASSFPTRLLSSGIDVLSLKHQYALSPAAAEGGHFDMLLPFGSAVPYEDFTLQRSMSPVTGHREGSPSHELRSSNLRPTSSSQSRAVSPPGSLIDRTEYLTALVDMGESLQRDLQAMMAKIGEAQEDPNAFVTVTEDNNNEVQAIKEEAKQLVKKDRQLRTAKASINFKLLSEKHRLHKVREELKVSEPSEKVKSFFSRMERMHISAVEKWQAKKAAILQERQGNLEKVMKAFAFITTKGALPATSLHLVEMPLPTMPFNPSHSPVRDEESLQQMVERVPRANLPRLSRTLTSPAVLTEEDPGSHQTMVALRPFDVTPPTTTSLTFAPASSASISNAPLSNPMRVIGSPKQSIRPPPPPVVDPKLIAQQYREERRNHWQQLSRHWIEDERYMVSSLNRAWGDQKLSSLRQSPNALSSPALLSSNLRSLAATLNPPSPSPLPLRTLSR
eukprot:CAMPEP_0184665482 /NCGR_PEP_ID=MMETSP0308-20130426/57404_1 /TAXON_ID=38269 /ORGANISM="Gloeochaete witrockiana, Strain SAG 46.84" /LENGTH=1283 /DNA_ID=CAMNT_0027109503 /DNA_START=8 /DNA_END=3859 /DNA_ORIENTATION=+